MTADTPGENGVTLQEMRDRAAATASRRDARRAAQASRSWPA